MPPPGMAAGAKVRIKEAPFPCVLACSMTALLCVVLFFQAGAIEELAERCRFPNGANTGRRSTMTKRSKKPGRRLPRKAKDAIGWMSLRNVNKVVYAVYAICGCFSSSIPWIHKHGPFAIEHWFGFYGIFGFVACVALVLAAKELRRLLMRSEDYYDD